MVKKSIVLALVLAVALLAGCVGPDDGNVGGDGIENVSGDGIGNGIGNDDLSNPGEAIKQELEENGFSVTKVDVQEKSVSIGYTQALSESPEDVYANWAYIFGVALNKVQNPEKVEDLVITCNFEDGEIVKVSTGPGNVEAFLSNEIDSWDFLYELDIEPLTKGPQIWTGA